MLPAEIMATTLFPKKKSELGSFTAAEIRLIMASVLCTTGRVDTDKLGKLTSTKKTSAASRFPSVKRKLEKMFEDQLDTIDGQNDSSAKEKTPAKSRTNKRREKVVEAKPKPEIKVEVKSGETTDSRMKVEAESGESINSPVKVESDSDSGESIDTPVKKADTDVKIKPEPLD
ncbi:unnamed protein product [Penicillium egyptiacum]|uniref:Uncharacterized protein n=1 Tax=Penicillium egyptiacum TaxID=1303716 RepID=A0A9W4KIF5_9EURO|nr:unnamed protein product [Penicillium egyptiacum]